MADLTITAERVATWRQHFADLIETGKQGWWRRWDSRLRREQDVAHYLLNSKRITDTPEAFLEWPCGWFVRFTNGRVVLVVHEADQWTLRTFGVVEIRRAPPSSGVWNDAMRAADELLAARRPLHENPARLGDALVGIAGGLILLAAVFGWAVMP